jgi:nucleoid-associated protein YgaU
MQHSLKHFFKSTRSPQISLLPVILILGAFIIGWLSKTWYDQVLVSPIPAPQTEQKQQEPEQLKVIYEVRPGDSLWSIAKGTYGDGRQYSEIAKQNGLAPETRLEIGQKLVLPVPQFPTLETKDSDVVTVRPGDSLWSLAQKHLGSGNRWQELYQLNHRLLGSNPDRIYPGQHLMLPVNRPL